MKTVVNLKTLCLSLLLALFALAVHSARATSLTVDEGLHIASGYTILRTGDYRLVEEHPPLIKLWLALPLLPLHDLADPTTLPAWEEAAHPTTESLPLLNMTRQLLYTQVPFERWLIPARIMSALLAVLLGATVWRWATDLRGPRAGLLALALLICDPNILAQASVAGTDLGAVFYITLALFCLTRYLHRPTASRLLLAGITLGLAQGAKLSALLLLPLGAGLLLLTLRKDRLRATTLYLLCAGLMLWALYRFQIGRVPGLPFPVPASGHAIPWLRLRQHAADGHAAFLLGENTLQGWWYYFPIAFVLKTPLPVLLLGLYGLVRTAYGVLRNFLVKQRPPFHRTPDALRITLYSFPILYALASLASSLNIGYRHLVPVLPFLYIGIANGEWQSAKPTAHVSRFTFYILHSAQYAILLWLALGTLHSAPHYLTYFNELAGGPGNGWRFLADSNTDWGQAYQDLARFQAEQGLGTVQLSAFIFYDPAAYGVNYTPLTPLRGNTPAIFPARLNPSPGDYVISATTLDGIPLVDPEMYDWFRWREPDARIANALFYYAVTPEETRLDWLAQCNLPGVPLDEEALQFGFSQPPPRQIYFNCTQAWIIPQSNAGVYAVHGSLLQDTFASRLHYAPPASPDDFLAQRLEPLRLTYRQRAYREEPAFALYHPRTGEQPPASRQWVANAGAAPQALADQPLYPAPLPLNGPLIFLGAQTIYTVTGIQAETWWQVTETPSTRPLSIMAHLVTETGETLAIADGLGVIPDMWQSGDIIIQRHNFDLTAENIVAAHSLRCGIYWADDGTRWNIVHPHVQGDALFIPLTQSHP